jgi:hypothetical protein
MHPLTLPYPCGVSRWLGRLRSRRGYLPPVVIPARLAKVVRSFEFAAIRAFGKSTLSQGMMRTPHIAARWRSLLFWNGHWKLDCGDRVRRTPGN